MLEIKLIGDQQLMLKLQRMPERVRFELKKAVTGLSFDLMRLVKRKLTNQVLNVRSGKLRDSIFQRVVEDRAGIHGHVASDGTVKYAGVHEWGGTINIPEIRPVSASALHFITKGGAEVFAKYARAHTVTMPERSYLRSSLRDMKDQIKRELTDAVMRGTR